MEEEIARLRADIVAIKNLLDTLAPDRVEARIALETELLGARNRLSELLGPGADVDAILEDYLDEEKTPVTVRHDIPTPVAPEPEPGKYSKREPAKK